MDKLSRSTFRVITKRMRLTNISYQTNPQIEKSISRVKIRGVQTHCS